jgi:hypothetical protein
VKPGQHNQTTIKGDYMSAKTVFLKTDLGLEEVNNRKHKLPAKLRTMLILIDGQHDESTLIHDAHSIGAPEDFLERLMSIELIMKRTVGTSAANDAIADLPLPETTTEPDEYTRFRAAKEFMNVSIVDAMGIRSFFFTLKLERAGNVADLRELAASYTKAIEKASGSEMAEVLSTRLRKLLR